MDRDHLAGILTGEGEAFVACRRAVLAGARFWVDESAMPASLLADTYARRERHTRKRGIRTLGFTEAVTALNDQGEALVLLGSVDTEDPPYHFQVFLNAAGTTVIACLGVDQSWNTQRHLTRPTEPVVHADGGSGGPSRHGTQPCGADER